ncbi:MAG: hypothetical protein AAF202_12730, partial [Pseudomonadota bacterium]
RQSLKTFTLIFIAGVAGSLITSFPVWYWNLTNDLSSVGYQLNHGFSDDFKLENPFEYILGQIAFLFPTTVFFAIRFRKLAPNWLAIAAVWPIAFFGFASLFANSEVNWPIVAHPAVIAIALLGTTRLNPSLHVPTWTLWTSGIYAGLVTLVVLEVFFNWIPSERNEIRTDVFRKFDRVADFVKGKENVYARSYQMASAVSFKNKSMFYKLRSMNRIDVYDFWSESIPKDDEFYLVMRKREKFRRRVRPLYEALSREPIDQQFELVKVRKK